MLLFLLFIMRMLHTQQLQLAQHEEAWTNLNQDLFKIMKNTEYVYIDM